MEGNSLKSHFSKIWRYQMLKSIGRWVIVVLFFAGAFAAAFLLYLKVQGAAYPRSKLVKPLIGALKLIDKHLLCGYN